MNLKTQMEKVIAGSYHNTAGMVILRNGEKVYENYYNGYDAENTVQVASVTKSIVSALFGIALEQKYIGSIEQKILDFFPDYLVARGERTLPQITIKDMLTMTVPYKCQSEPYTKVFMEGHWIETALNLLGGRGQIGTFRYSPMVGVQILSGILTKATGQSMLEFATKNLFAPLGIIIRDSITFQCKEDYLTFLESKDQSVWVADQEGYYMAGWGLTLTPADMAKIGQLYLNKGMWEHRQMIPAEWIEESTRQHSRCNQWKLSYGYLWWVIDEAEHIYAAMGDGGNIIYVNHAKNLVVAIACSFMPQAKDRLQLIKKYIEPAFA